MWTLEQQGSSQPLHRDASALYYGRGQWRASGAKASTYGPQFCEHRWSAVGPIGNVTFSGKPLRNFVAADIKVIQPSSEPL